MTLHEFIKTIQRERKLATGWYAWRGVVEDKGVTIKAYKTWLQRYTVDGIDNSNCADQSVKQFIIDLKKPFVKGL